MRSDARANRAALVEAAMRLLSVRGSELPMSAVAQEAGVGIGTLYRHFPTRSDLVEGILEETGAKLVEVSRRWAQPMRQDPGESWPLFVAELVSLRLSAFMPALAEVEESIHDGEQIQSIRERVVAELGEIVQVASESGLVSVDLSAANLLAGIGVVSRPVPPGLTELIPDLGDWLVEVFLRGLRP